MKAIIPCAGFGTRMGMRPDQSKEMLLDPYSLKGQLPVIDYCLEQCRLAQIEPLIVTRKEKQDLIAYCQDKAEILIIEPEGEWPNTILAASPVWAETNVLILPDTRFAPTEVLTFIRNDLEYQGVEASIGLHKVDDATNWCMVKDSYIVEKPMSNARGFAMGLLGFRRSTGTYIFEGLQTRGKQIELFNTSYQYLSYFKDITRTGRVEY